MDLIKQTSQLKVFSESNDINYRIEYEVDSFDPDEGSLVFKVDFLDPHEYIGM